MSQSIPINEEDVRPVILFGPSGSGKSTLVKKIMKDFPNQFGFSISHTTRNPRPGEVNGTHYHFTTRDNMLNEIDQGKFIEHVEFGKNLYGTSKAAVEDVHKNGQICLLDIDVQGVKLIKKMGVLNPWYVLICPPSMEELKRRLIKRGTENEESLDMRMKLAKEELEYGNTPGNAHLVIVNDNLESAYEQLKNFINSYVLKNI